MFRALCGTTVARLARIPVPIATNHHRLGNFRNARGFHYASSFMTLLDAQQFDEARARKRKAIILWSIIAVLILAWAVYHFRNYPERRAVTNFFAALQKQDYETAYGIWFNDPGWRQNPNKYPKYPFNDFYRDWSTSGQWGLIKSYQIDCSLSQGGSGVIVQVTVNGRAEHPYLWVQKSDKTLSFSPNEIECGNWYAWLTE
jgi:hypothetical protein